MFCGPFKDTDNFNPLLPVIGILLAKSIVLWGPILEILLNVDVRRNLFFYHMPQSGDYNTENCIPLSEIPKEYFIVRV